MFKSIDWTGDSLRIIDQTQIPERLQFRDLVSLEEVYQAIKRLQVRGAPAIGVAAAFGLYLGLRHKPYASREEFLQDLEIQVQYLKGARPTAVNLSWALNKIQQHLKEHPGSPSELLEEALKMAQQILEDDRSRCEAIATRGAALLPDEAVVITHCNTGILATAGIGTALGIVYKAFEQGKRIHVFVDETRPILQGARLTMWELQQAGIPATLITDNMAAYAIKEHRIALALVGADRIAKNGDVANKIGTFSLAISCHYHRIPFYVAAPLSTFDFSIPDGSCIPIEQRDPVEVTHIWNKLPITVRDANCWNPAFDVTPAKLITGIVTEHGILSPPFEESLEKINNKVHPN